MELNTINNGETVTISMDADHLGYLYNALVSSLNAGVLDSEYQENYIVDCITSMESDTTTCNCGQLVVRSSDNWSESRDQYVCRQCANESGRFSNPEYFFGCPPRG